MPLPTSYWWCFCGSLRAERDGAWLWWILPEFIPPLCFVSLQLTARLNVLDEHPSFAASSDSTDNSPAFPPEKSASYTPASLTGHIPAISAILSCSDQYLARHPSQEELAERSDSYGPFAEAGGRSAVQEAALESNQCQMDSAICFGDTLKVKYKSCYFTINILRVWQVLKKSDIK